MGEFDELNCEKIEELLGGYLDSELSEAERVKVDGHLAICISCTHTLKEIKSVKSLLNDLPAEKAERDFSLDIDEIMALATTAVAPVPLNCEEVLGLIDEYHDQELDRDKSSSVEAHINECDNCFKALASIQSLSSLLRTLPRESPATDYSQKVDDLLAGKVNSSVKETKLVPFPQRKGLTISAVAAALILLVIAGAAIIPSHNGNSNSSIKTARTGIDKNNLVANQTKTQKPDQQVGLKEVASSSQEKSMSQRLSREEENLLNVKPPTIAKTTPSEEKQNKNIEQPTVASIKVAPPIVKQSSTNPASPVSEVPIPTQLTSTEAYVAYDTEEGDDLFSQMGVSTNEDGLYAIKL